jgi:ABC-type sulfate transport system substrate-binding protein
MLNVSYDPTREFYQDFNAAFSKHWKAKTGDTVTRSTSRTAAPASRPAVIDGLQADVVTLALAYDIDAIADAGLIPSTGRSVCRTTRRPTPRRSSFWSARAIPRESGTGTIW